MEPEVMEYKGHRIQLLPLNIDELRARGMPGDVAMGLNIDDEVVLYGQLPDGQYYLHDFAYDWQPDLIELARRFIDYRTDTETGGKSSSQEGQ